MLLTSPLSGLNKPTVLLPNLSVSLVKYPLYPKSFIAFDTVGVCNTKGSPIFISTFTFSDPPNLIFCPVTPNLSVTFFTWSGFL